MGKYVGADWASKGWATAVIQENRLRTEFHPTVWNLWHKHADADQICIDIPIGLAEAQRRACDVEAKTELDGRASSVFWTPIRRAVEMDDFEAAKNLQEAEIGHRISNQAWAIVPRIQEVDLFLRTTEAAREIVRESHPELCFQALTGSDLVSKTDTNGLESRFEAVCDALAVDSTSCRDAVETLTQPEYAARASENDVLDALILVATAERVSRGAAQSLPKSTGFDAPPTDAHDLRMEIVYPDPDTDSRKP